jgi:hypothetical protein
VTAAQVAALRAWLLAPQDRDRVVAGWLVPVRARVVS